MCVHKSTDFPSRGQLDLLRGKGDRGWGAETCLAKKGEVGGRWAVLGMGYGLLFP